MTLLRRIGPGFNLDKNALGFVSNDAEATSKP
jgi:hypothetical protein